MSQERQILALGVTARNSRHHGARRIDSSLLAEQIICNVRVTNPDVHLTTDSAAEDTLVFIGELPHGEPRAIGIDIVNAAKVGYGASWTGHELQAGATRRLIVHEEVVEKTEARDEGEHHGADGPLVGEEDGCRIFGLEQRVGRDIMGVHIVGDLGHNDGWRDRCRHGGR
jgi:hypothetical protein